MSSKSWIAAGAFSAAIAVALGAFGAHALSDLTDRQLTNWQTATQYHRFHAIGLISVGILLNQGAVRLYHAAGFLMLAGTVLFSGLLYIYAVTELKWMVSIFPIGGISFILGWVLLGLGAWNQRTV